MMRSTCLLLAAALALWAAAPSNLAAKPLGPSAAESSRANSGKKAFRIYSQASTYADTLRRNGYSAQIVYERSYYWVLYSK